MRISDWSSDVCSSDLSDQASESTNEANDARGCSEVRRMATPTSGPPLVCAKAPSPLRAGCPAAPGQGAHHVMLNAFVANADLLGDFPIRHAFQAVQDRKITSLNSSH